MVALASLGGLTFPIEPSAVNWTYQMKTAQQRTLGGTVVQVFGVNLGDMTVTGSFGNGSRARGDTEGWQAQERFRKQVQTWTEQAISNSGAKPLRFLFPAYKWDFQVFVKGFTSSDGNSVHHNDEIINPQWTLTLFIVADSTGVVTKGIKDAYLSRLMTGVGWRQTQYNGPSAQDVATTLKGQSVVTFVENTLNNVAQGKDANATTTTPGTSGSNTSGSTTGTVGTAQIRSYIQTAFEVLGRTPSAQDINDVATIIQYESTNNPKAVNGGDSNAAAGHPSKGLMQLIDTTFAENSVAPYNTDIFDPVSNIIGGIRYAEGRYGSIHNVPGLVALRAGRAYVGY